MILYLNLYLGHLLGDFVFQPGWLVVAKRKGIPGLAGHLAVILLATSAVLVTDLPRLWPVVLYVTLAHLAIEAVTLNARRRKVARGIFIFALDQALHMATLALPMMLLHGWLDGIHPATFGLRATPGSLGVACGLGTVMFLGSILVFEAAEAADPREDDPILPLDLPRVLGMLERGAALAAALVAGPAALAVPFLPRVLLALRRPPEQRLRQVTIVAAGLALCTAAYVLTAAISTAAPLMDL